MNDLKKKRLLSLITISPPWMMRAQCRDADPELFFPEDTEPHMSEALRICRHCPVQIECLRWSLETGEKYGILGGKTPRQRTVIRKRMLRRKEIREPRGRAQAGRAGQQQ